MYHTMFMFQPFFFFFFCSRANMLVQSLAA